MRDEFSAILRRSEIQVEQERTKDIYLLSRIDDAYFYRDINDAIGVMKLCEKQMNHWNRLTTELIQSAHLFHDENVKLKRENTRLQAMLDGKVNKYPDHRIPTKPRIKRLGK